MRDQKDSATRKHRLFRTEKPTELRVVREYARPQRRMLAIFTLVLVAIGIGGFLVILHFRPSFEDYAPMLDRDGLLTVYGMLGLSLLTIPALNYWAMRTNGISVWSDQVLVAWDLITLSVSSANGERLRVSLDPPGLRWNFEVEGRNAWKRFAHFSNTERNRLVVPVRAFPDLAEFLTTHAADLCIFD